MRNVVGDDGVKSAIRVVRQGDELTVGGRRQVAQFREDLRLGKHLLVKCRGNLVTVQRIGNAP
eukprot:79415-Amphidinium_carterae.1